MRIDIHHYIHHAEEESRLARIEALLTTLITQGDSQMATMQEAMAALTAEVTRNTSVDQSAVVLLNGLADQIAELLAAQDVAGLEALVATLRADTDGLAAAVTANTPVVPPPPVEPA
jgi:hypothetical protein